jgi:hypothetical protein
LRTEYLFFIYTVLPQCGGMADAFDYAFGEDNGE